MLGFEIRVHKDAAIERNASLFGQGQTRTHANTNDDRVGLQHAAASERRALAVDRDHGIPEMKDDTMLLMQRAHEVADVGAEHTLHWPLFRCDDMDLDFPRAQCRRGLEPDEAGADNNRAARAFDGVNDRSAIR